MVIGNGTDSNGAAKGFIYNDGVYTELLPPGWIDSYAVDINDSGTVVGYGYDGTTGTYKGFIYSDGTYTELLPPGWIQANARKINEREMVIGNGDDSNFAEKEIYL